MSQFSRRARWLNDLFPASVLPQSQDPGTVSDDVSLVQPYDGSGWGFTTPDFTLTSPILSGAPNDFHIFFTLPDDEVFRLMSGVFTLLLDPANSNLKVALSIIDRGGTGNLVPVTELFSKAGSAMNPGESRKFLGISPIVGPGCQLRADIINNVATTQFTVAVYGFRAPLGTVFYV